MLGLNREKAKLVPHTKEWELEFENEKTTLGNIFSNYAMDIQHIGSTALPICAKPIIDILAGLNNLELSDNIVSRLKLIGYEYRPKASYPHRLFFAKGSPDNRTHHLHVVKHNSEEWNDFILFRDYLRTHEDALREYEQLKIRLAGEYSENRSLYTKMKSKFILNVISLAKQSNA